MSWWVLKRKLHPSWLIAVGSVSVFVGVYLAQYVSVFDSVAGLLIAAVIMAVVFARRYVYLVPLLIVAGILLGLWRGSVSQIELTLFRPLYGKQIVIAGSVKDDVDIGSSGQIVIRLGGLYMGGKSLPGVLYVTSATSDIKRGDKLVIHGKLQPGFGIFPGAIYRADVNQVIHPIPGDIARVVRDWFADGIRSAVPEPESSLGVGYLVGQRRALPADLVVALQAAGLTHIVVASGYNLTILVRLTRRLFAKVSKYLSVLFGGAMIVSFIAVTGVSPSMSRAGLVASLSLAAWYYGRQFHPLVLLAVAVAATVLVNPSYAWGDIGWQLSFAAFAGVMIMAPLTQRYLFGDRKPGFVQQVLIETASAQVATAPIIIAAFGQFSNIAIISNLLVLPLVPFAMLLTFVTGVGGIVAPGLAAVIGLPATWLLQYMVGVIDFCAGLPWATSNVQFPWWGVALCYAAIIGVCLYMWRVTGYNLRDANLVE